MGVVEKPAALSFGWHLRPAVLAAEEDGCREPVSHRRTREAVWFGERGVAVLSNQGWRKVGSEQVNGSPSHVWPHMHP